MQLKEEMKKLIELKIKKIKCKRLISLCIFLILNSYFLILNSSAQTLTANAGSDISVCMNDSVRIGGKPAATGGTPPYTYAWSPTTGIDVATAANPNAFPASTTPYTLTVTDGTGAITTSTITIEPLPTPTITVGDDQTILQGSSTMLEA